MQFKEVVDGEGSREGTHTFIRNQGLAHDMWDTLTSTCYLSAPEESFPDNPDRRYEDKAMIWGS